MKKLLVAAMFAFAGLCASAQDALIPMDYTETKPEDFYRYEQNVLNCMTWLMETPLDERQMERQVISQFVQVWMQASPTVVIYFDPKLIEFLEVSSYPDEQATVYVGGYLTALLKEKQKQGTLDKMTALPKGISKADRITGAMGAVESSVEFYDNNRGTLGRNRSLEKLRKMQKEGTLRKYVEANLEAAGSGY